MDSLKYFDDPNYYAVYFRKTIKQLERTLWPEAKQLYMPFLVHQDGPMKGKYIGKAKIQEQAHRITTPVGGTIEFSYLENDKDVQMNWQGAQVTGFYLDEGTHFSDFQVSYLRTRMRSSSEYPSFMRVSMNPDSESWVLPWIESYLDEDGYPKMELSCKTRYFVFDDGELVTSWSKEELKAKYPDKNPRTYTFVPSKLTDNKKMLENGNEDYADNLAANNAAQKAALLDGCWYYKDTRGSYFSRDWLQKVTSVPTGSRCARAWDKSGSIPSETYRSPDYTASVKMYKDKEGFYYITGEHHHTAKDADTEVYGRFRRLPGDRDTIIHNQATMDGTDCFVVFAIDAGQAGKTEFQSSSAKLMQDGFIVKSDPMPNNKDKLKRFEPFSSACQNGFVRILENTFPNKASLEHFYKEMETLSGDRSTAARKDDVPDAAASCFNFISRQRVLPSFTLPENNSSTAVTELRNLR